MAEQMPVDWRSEAFRRKVIAQIDEAVRMASTPMTKTSVEMENHVFMKAKTREEYLALVARLILHVKGINSQKDKDKKGPTGGPGGMMYAPQQTGMPQGGATGMQQQHQQPMQDPMNALQNLALQGTTVPGQQPGMLTPQQQAQMQQQRQQQLMQQHLIQQQRNMSNMPQQRPQLQQQQQQQQPQQPPPQQQYGHQNMPMGQPRPPVSMAAMSQQGFPQGNIVQQQQQQQQQMSQPSTISAVPSPIQQAVSASSGSQMTNSPISMMTSPSPQAYIVPSPASRGTTYHAPSPSTTSLNTPAAGSAQTPISQEDQVYLDKLNQLSKYIEPLRRIHKRMMNKQSADKDEDRAREINKIKNLLDILTDPSKRLPWTTLLKCEQVLLKLELEWDKTGEPVTTTTTPMCQPLLDAVAAHITSPMLNHSLQRTFGPAIAALHGSPIRAPSPPPKRRKQEVEDDIPHLLQGEIARLGGRFKVNFDPTQHGGSKDIHLICRLDDKNLPSIPSICVKIPETYPVTSPECNTKMTEYESNTFLQSVQHTLDVLLLRMPDKYTFTELLDKWEMSVRKACAASI